MHHPDCAYFILAFRFFRMVIYAFRFCIRQSMILIAENYHQSAGIQRRYLAKFVVFCLAFYQFYFFIIVGANYIIIGDIAA